MIVVVAIAFIVSWTHFTSSCLSVKFKREVSWKILMSYSQCCSYIGLNSYTVAQTQSFTTLWMKNSTGISSRSYTDAGFKDIPFVRTPHYYSDLPQSPVNLIALRTALHDGQTMATATSHHGVPVDYWSRGRHSQCCKLPWTTL